MNDIIGLKTPRVSLFYLEIAIESNWLPNLVRRSTQTMSIAINYSRMLGKTAVDDVHASSLLPFTGDTNNEELYYVHPSKQLASSPHVLNCHTVGTRLDDQRTLNDGTNAMS